MVAEWFRDAFDDLYLTVYRHRGQDEAERFLSWVSSMVDLDGARVLDLACGAGRFRSPLIDGGAASYVGLDLSRDLLRAARRDGAEAFVRGDMRRFPLADASFDLVVSMFTSLGYFATDENHAVVREMGRVLRADGAAVVDVLNPAYLRRTLVPESERHVEGLHIRERRAIVDGRVEKRVFVDDADGARVREYVESVELIDEATLVAWATDAGLDHVGSRGTYDGDPIDDDDTPRIIAVFRGRSS